MSERILILAFMLLFNATGTFAQNKSVVISGIIKDKADKTALSYSNIYERRYSRGACHHDPG
jgi:hypothetical protein